MGACVGLHGMAWLGRPPASWRTTRAGVLASRAPRFAGHWLSVASALVLGPVQVAVAGSSQALVDAAVANVHGGAVVVSGDPDSSALLTDRPLVDGQPAAYVCRGYVCDRPVTSVDDLVTALSRE